MPMEMDGGRSDGEVTRAEFYAVMAFAKQGYAQSNWDGLKEWTRLKERYSEANTGKWTGPILSPPYAAYRTRILAEMPEFTADGSTIPAAHFFIQCLRVPFKNPFSHRRLMQVAYNIGQLQGAIEEIKPSDLQEFLVMRLDSIETYII
jgi:hypothetical protein